MGFVLARALSLATATLPTDPDALRDFAARLQAKLYAKTHPWPPIGRGPTRGVFSDIELDGSATSLVTSRR